MINAMRSRWVSFGQVEVRLAMHLNLTRSKTGGFVLQHILGYFKKRLGAHEKAELLGMIGDYHHGRTPLIVPLTLTNRSHVAQSYVADCGKSPAGISLRSQEP